MTRLARSLALALSLVLLVASVGHASPVVAGSEGGAWILAPGVTRGMTLYRLRPGEPGVADVAASFPSEPMTIAADDASVVLVFHPSDTPPDEDAPRVHPVRRLTMTGDDPRPIFSRPHVLAPLSIEGRVVQLAIVAGAPVVVVREPEPGMRLRILRLAADGWTPVPTPAALDPTARTWLVESGPRLALVQQAAVAEVRVWWTPIDDLAGQPRWEAAHFSSSTFIRWVLGAPEGRLEPVARHAGDLRAFALGDGALLEGRTIDDVPPACDVGRSAGALAIAWADTDADSGVALRLTSPVGDAIYRGPMRVAGPVSPGEVQAIVVMLAAILMMAVIFVLKPEIPTGQALRFPAGASLASPTRRTIAFLIDAAPGLAVAYLLWFHSLDSLADATSVLAEQGAAPIMAAAMITIILCAVGEATTGRTLGKAVVRCRTIGFDGSRPSWRQALARSAVKVLCPPLALYVMLSPIVPHPGAFETLVIVDRPGRRPDAAAPTPNDRHD